MRQMGNLEEIGPNYASLYFIIHPIGVSKMLSSVMGYIT